MKKNDAFPSKFLKAADIEDEDVTLTIRNVTSEEMTDGKEKRVAWFKEFGGKNGKGLVVNATNWDIIAKMHGDDDDDWSGKKISLTVEDVNFQGKMVPSIRVKEVRQPKRGTVVYEAQVPAKASAGAPADTEDEADIPF